MYGRKTVAFVIAPENFRDEELFIPRQELEKAGFVTVVASTQIGTATGMLGATVEVQSLIPDLRAENLSALIIVGGVGSPRFLQDSLPLHVLAQKMIQNGKPVGAICLSPAVLARAGLLKGKKATVYKELRALEILKEGGATYVSQECVSDGLIVTANGPSASEAFATEMLRQLGTPAASH